MYGLMNLPNSLIRVEGGIQVEGGKVRATNPSGWFYIEGLEQNCSFLTFTSFNWSPTAPKSFFKQVEIAARWASHEGNYTKIFCTMSDDPKRAHLREWLLKCGFKRVGKKYTNKRTGKEITWFQGDIDEMLTIIKEM